MNNFINEKRNTKILLYLLLISMFFYLIDSSFKIVDVYNHLNYRKISSPFITKWLRDISFIIVLAYLYIQVSARKMIILSFGLIVILITMIYQNPLIQNLAGLKLFVPFLIFLTPIDDIKISIDARVLALFKSIFAIHFILQLVNFFSGKGLHGVYSFGASARSIGLETSPAMTSYLTICLFHLISSISKKLNPHLLLLTIISVGLSNSLMGMIVLGIIILIYFPCMKKLSAMYNSFTYVFFVILTHLSRIVGKDVIEIDEMIETKENLKNAMRSVTYLKFTGGTRIDMMKNSFKTLTNSDFFLYPINHFGLNTSWGYSVRKGIMGESIFTAIIQNSSWIFFILFVSTSVYLVLNSKKYLLKNRELVTNSLIFILGSFTLITTEFLLAMIILYLAKIILIKNIYSNNVVSEQF